jgi:hypothetical protein
MLIVLGLVVAAVVSVGIAIGNQNKPIPATAVALSAILAGTIATVGGYFYAQNEVGIASESAKAEGRAQGESDGARMILQTDHLKPGIYHVVACVTAIGAAVVTEPDGRTAMYKLNCGTNSYSDFVVGKFYQANEAGGLVLISDSH